LLFEGFDEAQVLLLGHMLNPLCCLVMFGQGLAVTAICISILLQKIEETRSRYPFYIWFIYVHINLCRSIDDFLDFLSIYILPDSHLEDKEIFQNWGPHT
jgi:hypothetical protein